MTSSMSVIGAYWRCSVINSVVVSVGAVILAGFDGVESEKLGWYLLTGRCDASKRSSFEINRINEPNL